MSQTYALVMAGGKGTRLWPESTSRRPKQYLPLVTKNTLLQDTLERFEGLVPKDHRYIVTVKEQSQLAQQSVKGLAAEGGIIHEPQGRNTGPCILLALAELLAKGAKENDVVAIVPADQVILNADGFRKTLSLALKMAHDKGLLVTIGIVPHFPHTGFGYIKRGKSLEGQDIHAVESFKEKPNFQIAKEYVASGEYYWNAGMFVATISTLLREFEAHAPEMFKHWAALKASLQNEDQLNEAYGKLPAISIDYAVLEKSDKVAVARAQFDWNDLGSWDALESVIPKRQGNTFVGDGPCFVKDARGNVVFAPGKFVSLVDVQDLIILVNEGSVTVMPKSSSQKVKDIVEHLQKCDDLKLKRELL